MKLKTKAIKLPTSDRKPKKKKSPNIQSEQTGFLLEVILLPLWQALEFMDRHIKDLFECFLAKVRLLYNTGDNQYNQVQ